MQKVILNEELMLHISPDSHNQNKYVNQDTTLSEHPDQTKLPKLTMKLLHELIKELRQENAKLYHRVTELERQLEELAHVQVEAAAAAELANPIDKMKSNSIETAAYPANEPSIRVTRSQRHPAPKKKSWEDLWHLLFRPSLQRQK
ncbi:hypothetical protein [Paenibacillus radicis (ex Xue et al. 2023)]|uniref:Uncharacterized protein n=1 Tax=Paenibacillus radicis (ex Xue et al. 2023) TaxID=2972489 RepID=A0ABT1YGW0_9BACL|nr:hypothetical protein [Paenibacillus radicis (ex Xue et al. 2023)]MCR8631468.1 hypothetical protein [Paenibacillus radicis (ex Xue et al. 2023)]